MADRKTVVQVKHRLRRDLLQRIMRSAKTRDRSVNEEIEFRLEGSFWQEEIEKLTGAVKLQVRLPERIHGRLEQAAKHNNWSINTEIFGRLDESFQREDRKKMEKKTAEDAVQALREPLSPEEWEKQYGGGPSADS
jgi:hypothetical protein